MPSRSIYAVANGKMSFFLTAKWYSIVDMNHLSILSSIVGH